jgi:hypothetical protein
MRIKLQIRIAILHLMLYIRRSKNISSETLEKLSAMIADPNVLLSHQHWPCSQFSREKDGNRNRKTFYKDINHKIVFA